MNSLSKVTLLVTLLTIPFAGFAMFEAGDFPSVESTTKSVEQTTEAVTTAATTVTKGVLAMAQENPVIAAGIVLVGAGASWGIYKLGGWLLGKSANAEAKAKNPITVAIAKGKLDSATLTEWAKNPKKLNDKLAERGITMAQYQEWVA